MKVDPKYLSALLQLPPDQRFQAKELLDRAIDVGDVQQIAQHIHVRGIASALHRVAAEVKFAAEHALRTPAERVAHAAATGEPQAAVADVLRQAAELDKKAAEHEARGQEHSAADKRWMAENLRRNAGLAAEGGES